MQFNEILDKLTRLEPKRCEYRQVGSQQYKEKPLPLSNSSSGKQPIYR